MVKICPKCGRRYTKDYNFCIIHDVAIELCYIKDLVKQCPGCKAKYPESYNYCIKCEWDEPLVQIGQTPPKRNYKVRDIDINPNSYYNFKHHLHHYDNLDDLLSSLNIALLKEFNITESNFEDIIENITYTYQIVMDDLIEEYDIDFEGLHILDKILLFSKSFAKTEYKAGGGDLGHYVSNYIYIDDRQEAAYQITTMIHEISHFIFKEIFEQVISILLNTDKTDLIEGLVCWVLEKDPFNNLIDEYCAHTVEGRFAPIGYQDYGSYIKAVDEFSQNHSPKLVETAEVIGNTFAQHIMPIIESFVGEYLREEIKIEFNNLKDKKEFDTLGHETDETWEWNTFSQAIRLILTKNIDAIASNSQDRKKVLEYGEIFKKNNG